MLNRIASKSLRDIESLVKIMQYQKIYKMFRNYTMLSEATYIKNLLISNKISMNSGCVIECGVWRGGMIAGIANLLGSSRKYFLFDSFEGLPPAQKIDGDSAIEWQSNPDSELYFDNNTAPIEFAQDAMSMAGIKNYEIIKGWFSDTLPNFKPPENIALLRLDGDWYESTMTCLESLMPHMAPNGIVIIDDYYTWDGCSKAVHDYLSSRSSTLKILCGYNEIAMMHNKNLNL
jgi:O-methyltransferase